MAEKKGLGSVKRYGVRYGRTTKHKLAKIELEQRGKHKCPFCSKMKVSRISAGIWQCEKCEMKFAGRAYVVGEKQALVEETTSMVAHAPKIRLKKVVEEE